VSDSEVPGQGHHKLAVPSRIHWQGFDHFSDFVHVFSQLLLVKISTPSQRAFKHGSASLDELKTLQKAFEYIVPILGSHIAASYSAVPAARQVADILAINQRGWPTYAVSGDNTRISSSSYQIHRTPGGCGKQDDVPEDCLKFRNVDTSSRHDLRPVFLRHRTGRHLRLDAAAFDAVSPWALS
jgi:hypothetical protein